MDSKQERLFLLRVSVSVSINMFDATSYEATVKIDDAYLKTIDRLRQEYARIKESFPELSSLVLHDSAPDFVDSMHTDVDAAPSAGVDAWEEQPEFLDITGTEPMLPFTSARVAACYLHVSDTGIWWEARFRYEDHVHETGELPYSELFGE